MINGTRRGFLKGLIAAAVAPAVLIKAFSDTQTWKRQKETGLLLPSYEDAEYEEAIIFHPQAYTGDFRYRNFQHIVDPFPLRYTFKGGSYIQVPHPGTLT